MLVKRHRHGDRAAYYVIEQPDGTLVHLPAWMTRSEAAELPDHSPPRLALTALHDLRRLLDQVVSSSASQSLRGDNHAQGSTVATGSVCQYGGEPGTLSTAVRAKVTILLQALMLALVRSP